MGFATAVHARTRYIDEMFKESLAAGATQVVILGAGLDSRAYRFAPMLRGARVFEVDFPPTQEYKKKRVREVLMRFTPRHLGPDFTRKIATVYAGRVRQHKEDRVRIDGVTLYIPEAAVTELAVLRRIPHWQPIVFDIPSEARRPGNRAINKRLNAPESLHFRIRQTIGSVHRDRA